MPKDLVGHNPYPHALRKRRGWYITALKISPNKLKTQRRSLPVRVNPGTERLLPPAQHPQPQARRHRVATQQRDALEQRARLRHGAQDVPPVLREAVGPLAHVARGVIQVSVCGAVFTGVLREVQVELQRDERRDARECACDGSLRREDGQR